MRSALLALLREGLSVGMDGDGEASMARHGTSSRVEAYFGYLCLIILVYCVILYNILTCCYYFNWIESRQESDAFFGQSSGGRLSSISTIARPPHGHSNKRTVVSLSLSTTYPKARLMSCAATSAVSVCPLTTYAPFEGFAVLLLGDDHRKKVL